jgi:glycosyltransferase involved in cell wall biosynthesis
LTDGGLFVSWVPFHGRSQDLADHLGIPCAFVTGGTGPAPLRYLRAGRETRRLLRRHRPEHVFVMLPPTPALLAVLLWTRAPRTRVFGDLHTGAFSDPKWRWALRPTLWSLRRRGAAIVTNRRLGEVCEAAGVPTVVANDVVAVLHPPPDHVERLARLRAELGCDRFALAPVGYGHDEPITELLVACADLPVAVVLTGAAPASVVAAAPANVRFSGFLDREDLDALLAAAEVVVALTRNERTMQRAGYEGLGFGRPLVLSSTPELREFFEEGAVYVEPTAVDIERGLREALAAPDAWARRSSEQLAKRLRTQVDELAAVEALAR